MKTKAYLPLVSLAVLFHLLWFFRVDLAPYAFFGINRASIDAVAPYSVPHPWKTAAVLMGDVLRVVLFGPEKPEPVYCLEVLEPVEVVAAAPRPLPAPSAPLPPPAGSAVEEEEPRSRPISQLEYPVPRPPRICGTAMAYLAMSRQVEELERLPLRGDRVEPGKPKNRKTEEQKNRKS